MVIFTALLIVCTCLSSFIRLPESGFINARRNISNYILIFAVFTLLFALSALRISAHDYGQYTSMMDLIYQFRHVSSEFGFNAVVRFIQVFFGKDNHTIVFAVFSFATVFLFMKAITQQSKLIAVSVFIFMASGFYFNSFNNIRYYLALGIALYAAKFALQKRYVNFIFAILIAATFHKTALVAIPLYFLCSIRWKKAMMIAGGIFIVQFVLLKNVYEKLLLIFYPYYGDFITGNFDLNVSALLRCAAITGLGVVFYKTAVKNNAANLFYFKASVLTLIIYIAGSYIPELSRIAYYTHIGCIIMLPNVIVSIDNKKIRNAVCAAIMLAYAAYFCLFLKDCYDEVLRLLPYRSWFI